MDTLEELLEIVYRADFEEIERARDRVRSHHLGGLAKSYASLDTWDQKAALINLVQDHLDPRFRPMMLDFLQAPDANWDDTVMLTKAIALCHLDDNLDNFMRYYNDQRLIQERIQEYQPAAQRETSTHHTKEKPRATPQNSPWQIAGVTALIVGVGLLLITFNNWRTLQQYRREGITVEARVTGKSNQDNETCIGVSFFDKGLFDGGELYLTEICNFVPGDIRDTTRRGAHEDVIFLPENPQQQVIFAAALANDQSVGVVIGGGLVIMGLLALVWDRKKSGESKQGDW